MSLSLKTTAKDHESPETLGCTPTSITPPTVPDTDNETTVACLPLGLELFFAVIAAIVMGFVVLHLTGGGLGSHGH
jgi:hypothetical protein